MTTGHPRSHQTTTPRLPMGVATVQELMASSASGIHFGHYMAGTFNPEILVVNAMLVDIPLKTGFSYACWKKGLNIMIEKMVGDFNIEKLCIILLFEANFNANNKWNRQAEQHELMAPEQFGSHKFKTAIHQCLNKKLFYNLHRFNWSPAALCSNNAKSCYDHITLWPQLYVCAGWTL